MSNKAEKYQRQFPVRKLVFAMAMLAPLALSAPASSQDTTNRTRILMQGDFAADTVLQQTETALSNRKLAVEASEVSLMMPVEFDYDSAALRYDVQHQLHRVASILNDPRMRGYRFVVEGHTDVVGSDAYNQPLSERRAFSVVNYLASVGVDRSRMIPVGYGRTMLLQAMSPYDGRNRRVEFVLLPD